MMSQREAVFEACEQLGHKSKAAVVQQKAEWLYGGDIAINHIYKFRKQWQATKGLPPADCRTYEGQPRRDQRRDDVITTTQLKRIKSFLNEFRTAAQGIKVFNTLVGKTDRFHSLEQVEMAFNELTGLQLAAA